MADKYLNWAALAAAKTAGIDYRLVNNATSATTSHIAIHAGGIEPGSGELAKAVGARLGHQVYCMEATMSSGNSELHITSTNYDEPLCVAMQGKVTRTISYHGAQGATPITYLGGLDTGLITRVGTALEAAGFTVDFDTADEINGDDSANICNRNLSKKGVQLEMSAAQRAAFFPLGNSGSANRYDYSKRTEAFYVYTDAVVTGVGLDLKRNRLNVWDGLQWVDVTPKTYTGSVWRDNPPLYFNGTQWMASAP
ncbi:poly-gamma-glutamate hydrolase family protein [Streptomyces sp. NPDC055036]